MVGLQGKDEIRNLERQRERRGTEDRIIKASPLIRSGGLIRKREVKERHSGSFLIADVNK